MAKLKLFPPRERLERRIYYEELGEVPRLTLLDRFDMFAYSLFGGFAKRYVDFFEYEKVIRRSGFYVNPVVYISRITLITLLSVPFGVIFLASALLLSLPILFKVVLAVVGVMLPFIVFITGYIYPWSAMSSRNSEVANELPYVAAYLTTMARGGISPVRSLKRLAESKLFPAIEKEARRMLRDVELFGEDPYTAIENVARYHPNTQFRDFLLGYVSTIRTGGDVIHYLETKTQALFEARGVELRKAAERMEAFTDLFVSSTVILGISFYVFFMISAIFPAGGWGGVTQLFLFLYVAMPMITVMILWFIHLTQPRTPIKLSEPFTIAAMFIPAAISAFLLLSLLDGSYVALFTLSPVGEDIVSLARNLTVAMIIPCIPGAIVYALISRWQMGFEEAVAEFLRDITEIRKTGMSPERSIIYAAGRSYGKFSKIARKIATYLSWGQPLTKAVEEITRKIRSWITVVTLRFLSDAIAVGGGSVLTLDTLSIFTAQINLLNRELKGKLRPYLIMPYVGSVISTASTLLVLNFMIETVSAGGLVKTTVNVWFIAMVFVLGLVLNAWLMGMAAGKISETYISAGFKHAIVLLIVTYLTIWAIFEFVILT